MAGPRTGADVGSAVGGVGTRPVDGGRRWAALAGVVATALALSGGELVAGILAGAPSLVLAVGAGVVEIGSGSRVKEVAVALFGTNDKQALVVGTIVLALCVGAALGVLGRRRGLPAAAAGFVAFAVLGVLATLVNPLDSTALATVPAVTSAAVGVLSLRWLLGVDARLAQAAWSAPADGARGPARSRREMVRISLGLLVVAGVAGVVGRTLGSRTRAVAGRSEVALPAAATTAPAVPEGAAFAEPDGLSPLFTPNDSFYRIDTALTTPMVDVSDWSLRVHGMVDREVRLTLEDLLAMPQVEADVTIACVSNEVGGGLIGNARWQGVPLAAVLTEAGLDPRADQVVGRSVDGWTAGFPTEVALDGRDAMVALAMNGEPLPIEHGFPARLIVPGLYGYVSATKWLAEIELTTWEAFDGYWIPRGWAKEGPVKTQSRIDVPAAGTQVVAGPTWVAGMAWAQRRGVVRVEVQVDDGEWQEAEMAAEISIDTWRQWRLRWDATPGDHVIRVRATDGSGVTQGAARVPVAPDGAEGYHTRVVRVA